MKLHLPFLLAIVIGTFSHSLCAEKQDEHLSPDYSNAKMERMESGDSVKVPEGIVTIPGLPLVVTKQDLEQTAAAAKSLNSKGYVDVPEHLPIAENALRGMREVAKSKQNNSANNLPTNVSSTRTFKFSKVDVGKVSPEILTGGSESYIATSGNDVFRVYSNTRFGDLYIHEMVDGKLGVIGKASEPNFYVNGAEGYKTKVRYANGKLSSLYLLRSERGVTFVELGNSSKEFIEDSNVEDFITTLVTARQN